jgi:regulator of sigma E protease
MQDILLNLVGFVLVLGFLIFAHESGHFFMAKLFRVRVLVFSFGFGKRLFGFRKGDTDYRVSLIPLGGYVRMAGDTPEENVAGSPDEFLSKPKWQRFLILFAGPFMNVFIAVSFVAIAAMVGFREPVTKPVISSVEAGKAGAKAGLQAGDRLVKLKGETIKDFGDVRMIISMNAGTPFEVVYDRGGVLRKTTMTPDRAEGEFSPVGRAGLGFGAEVVVGGTEPGSPAALAGLREGDRVLSANGQPVTSLDTFAAVAEKALKQPLTLELLRGTEHVRVTLAPSSDPDPDVALGRGIHPPSRLIKLGLPGAVRYSVIQNWKMLRLTKDAVVRLFRPEGSIKELSGPVNIARLAGRVLKQGWLDVILFMAMISLQLGVMNLLPIPVLDGGHIMILLIEGIARRDLSLRVKERIQQVGFAALATLMIVVLYNDVISNVLRLKNG